MIKSLALLTLCACFYVSSSPAESIRQDGAVQMLGDSQQRLPNGRVQAEGHAVLVRRDVTIRADLIEFDPVSTLQTVRAKGNVTFRQSESVLKCSELRLELTSGRGEFKLE